jgi:hypothetical protein
VDGIAGEKKGCRERSLATIGAQKHRVITSNPGTRAEASIRRFKTCVDVVDDENVEDDDVGDRVTTPT